jgi:hypothetical protein
LGKKKDDSDFFTETHFDESDYVRPTSDITRYRMSIGATKKLPDVLNDFHKVHGDKYDYSKVEYVDWKTDVIIICPDHGEFTQRPIVHHQGHDCPSCSRQRVSKERREKVLETLFDEFREVHGERYDYSKVEYQAKMRKVTIICRDHGEFSITPQIHLKGRGCPTCGRTNQPVSRIENKRKTILDEFRKVHGDRYDYSKVDYKGVRTKVVIICPDHGEFAQGPINHRSGVGCPVCGNEKRKKSKRQHQEDVIRDFRKVHGDRYDYSEVEYVNAATKITIICTDHGEFYQTPNNHKSSAGCRHCGYLSLSKSKSKINDEMASIIRSLRSTGHTFQYIANEVGVSSGTVSTFLKAGVRDPVADALITALDQFKDDKTFRLGEKGYVVKRSKGKGASGFVAKKFVLEDCDPDH